MARHTPSGNGKEGMSPVNQIRLKIRSGRRKRAGGVWGFTVLEMMVVITIIFMLLSIAIPNYRTSIIRSREAVLREHLFTLRSLIDQYTLDKKKGPQSLEDLVAEGYLREVPVDPITNTSSSWETESDGGALFAGDQTEAGIIDVHSGAAGNSLDGSPYSAW
jgi:general secretion pathway protein G